MNTRRISIGIISALFAASLAAGARADLGGLTNPASPTAPLAQNGSAFTYQGQLRKNGAPVNASCNASFSLFDAATGGGQVGGTVTSPTLQIANGLFTIPLDFGWAFNGEARWLEMAIGCGEAQTILTPRTSLRPAPYAFALPGMRTVPGDEVFMGVPTMNVIGGLTNGTFSNTIHSNSANSVIGGGMQNQIDNYSTKSAISGGENNRIAGGSSASAINGGSSNQIDNSSSQSVINGGSSNQINNSSYQSAIGGGSGNVISGTAPFAVIGGGASNRIDGGIFATVPGGTNNIAKGNYSLAAGAGARANHQGTFVWGDATNLPINSSGDNQFIIRANGGFAFVTTTGAYTPTIGSGVFITTTTGASLSSSGVWTANGIKFPDGKTQTSAAATPSNIIIVAKSGGHFSTISAALTSITDNSAANRYLVYVAPGTYTETVTMKPYVDIEGAGELATKITQVGSASGAPTLSGASNAELRFLTVENTGGFDFAVAIRNVSASPRLTHITAIALDGLETDGIRNISSSPRLEHVTASATSAGGNYGMYNLDSSPTVNNSVIAGSGFSSFGIYNATTGGSFVVRVTNSQIAGSPYTIFTIPSYTTVVVASQLSGGVAGGGGGTVTCVGVYDENFVAPGYTICP